MSKRLKVLGIQLDDPVWALLWRLKAVMNAQLKKLNKPELNVSGVASLVLETALLENAEDVQAEFQQEQQRSLAAELSQVLSDGELAACGFPEVPDGRRASGRPRRRTAKSA